MSKLDELERLEAEATRGPWVAAELTVSMGLEVFSGTPSLETGVATPWHFTEDRGRANAHLIALSRNMLPALIRVARAAKAYKAQRVLGCSCTDCEFCDPRSKAMSAALAELEGAELEK